MKHLAEKDEPESGKSENNKKSAENYGEENQGFYVDYNAVEPLDYEPPEKTFDPNDFKNFNDEQVLDFGKDEEPVREFIETELQAIEKHDLVNLFREWDLKDTGYIEYDEFLPKMIAKFEGTNPKDGQGFELCQRMNNFFLYIRIFFMLTIKYQFCQFYLRFIDFRKVFVRRAIIFCIFPK